MRRLSSQRPPASGGRGRALFLASGIGLFFACAGDGADTEVAATGAQTAGTGAGATATGGTGGAAGAATGGAGAGAAGSAAGTSGTSGAGVGPGGSAGAGKGGMGGAGKGGMGDAGKGGAGKGGMGDAGSAGKAGGAGAAGAVGGAGAGAGGAAGAAGAGAAGAAGAGTGGAVAGSGGEAGAGGEAGTAAGGSAGASPTSWTQCTLPGTCVARQSKYCCFACDMSEADGVYWKLVSQHDSEVCKGKPADSACGGPCYPKAHFQGQRFLGVCEEGVCSAVDVGKAPLSACTTNDDCVLRHAGCCPSCIPDQSRLIALAKDGVDDYLAQACNPEAPEACDACAPAFPEGASAVCNATGHCEVKPPPAVCPNDPPVEGTACAPLSVVYCDYGDGPVGCRDRFFCEKGAWKKKNQPCPATTVLTDCPADCSQKGVACSTDLALCTGANGALWGCQWGTWSCVSPPAPSPCAGNPPYNGQPCSQEGLACQYGGCGDVLATRRVCEKGVWVDQWGYCLL